MRAKPIEHTVHTHKRKISNRTISIPNYKRGSGSHAIKVKAFMSSQSKPTRYSLKIIHTDLTTKLVNDKYPSVQTALSSLESSTKKQPVSVEIRRLSQ